MSAKELLAATSLAEVLPTHSLVSGESSYRHTGQPARWAPLCAKRCADALVAERLAPL